MLNAAAKWNQRYAAGAGAEQAPLPGLLDACHDLRPGIALDLACGTGRHAMALAALGWRVIALDASAAAIESLRRAAAERAFDIDARLQDLEEPGFQLDSEAYDLVCDCFYLQRNLFSQIRLAVKPGGIFFGAFPMVDSEPGIAAMNADYLVHPGELAAEFQHWRILQYSESRPRRGARMIAQLTARRPASST